MFELSNELKYRAMRRKVHEDKYSIIGVEIKNRRMNYLLNFLLEILRL